MMNNLLNNDIDNHKNDKDHNIMEYNYDSFDNYVVVVVVVEQLLLLHSDHNMLLQVLVALDLLKERVFNKELINK